MSALGRITAWLATLAAFGILSGVCAEAEDFPKPYSAPCVEREKVFAFTKKPEVKNLGNDKYEISFAVKGNCDVTVGMVDSSGKVIRHLGAGVLGANAPEPFQKNSLQQTLFWNGKDDLEEYVKEPAKLRVRVQLGLRPVFDKILGDLHPKSLDRILGIAAGPEGVVVYSYDGLRKFDHEGRYVSMLAPPSKELPEEKCAGYFYMEYEPGKRSLHGPLQGANLFEGFYLPDGLNAFWWGPWSERPILANGRVYLLGVSKDRPPREYIYWFNLDGSTTVEGITGRRWNQNPSGWKAYDPMLAVSPDGRKVYLAGVASNDGRITAAGHVVLQSRLDEDQAPTVFAGESGARGPVPGSDDRHFNSAADVACDSAGRVYVTDSNNNRVQIFAEDGRFLKTLALDRPRLVQVHAKTGAIYVAHTGWDRGRSVDRITRFKAFPELTEERHWDVLAVVMALDSHSPKPRLWTCKKRSEYASFTSSNIVIYEDDGERLVKFDDFDQDVQRERDPNLGPVGRNWGNGTISCDPVREHVYTGNECVTDLRTGAAVTTNWFGAIPAGQFGLKGVYGGMAHEAQFDRRGYMHCRITKGFPWPRESGVGRLDPGNKYCEVPYDYGEEASGWKGALLTYKPTARYYSFGLGVNMRGDVVVSLELGADSMSAMEGEMAKRDASSSYAVWFRQYQENLKRDSDIFTWPQYPGRQAAGGGVLTTFNRNGELRDKYAVIAGDTTVAAQIDEDGDLYFANRCAKSIDGKPYLAGKAGVFGSDKRFTMWGTVGVYMKAQGKDVRFKFDGPNAKLPIDEIPRRPADLCSSSQEGTPTGEKVWVEGAKWIYGGVTTWSYWSEHCACSHVKVHLDWYKRSFVAETYRHSVAVLDTNGNLILHIGRYGNLDDIQRLKSGDEDIPIQFCLHVAGTDNYLVLNRCVLKLSYYAEETAGIELP